MLIIPHRPLAGWFYGVLIAAHLGISFGQEVSCKYRLLWFPHPELRAGHLALSPWLVRAWLMPPPGTPGSGEAPETAEHPQSLLELCYGHPESCSCVWIQEQTYPPKFHLLSPQSSNGSCNSALNSGNSLRKKNPYSCLHIRSSLCLFSGPSQHTLERNQASKSWVGVLFAFSSLSSQPRSRC